MRRFSRSMAASLLIAFGSLCMSSPLSLAQVSLRSVKVLGGKDTVEIEVEASDRIVPQTRVLTSPDRLVVDFPNTVPAGQVRSQSVDRGDVKDVRIGLFQSKPPVTRLVLDLKTARSYQIFPYGRTVVIKLMDPSRASEATAAAAEPATRPGYIPATYTTRKETAAAEDAPRKPLVVTFHNGLLSIVSNKATLSEVLYAVQQHTGADISIPAGAEQERVVADFEPAPAPEVLARLLNGSSFNFLILSAPDDPRHLDRVILSPRSDEAFTALAPMPQEADQASEDDTDGEPAIAPPPADVSSGPVPPILPEDAPNAANDGSPDR